MSENFLAVIFNVLMFAGLAFLLWWIYSDRLRIKKQEEEREKFNVFLKTLIDAKIVHGEEVFARDMVERLSDMTYGELKLSISEVSFCLSMLVKEGKLKEQCKITEIGGEKYKVKQYHRV